MKSPGRIEKPLTEEQINIAKEYLTTNQSYQDLADKYGVLKPQVVYWVTKYKKSQQMPTKIPTKN